MNENTVSKNDPGGNHPPLPARSTARIDIHELVDELRWLEPGDVLVGLCGDPWIQRDTVEAAIDIEKEVLALRELISDFKEKYDRDLHDDPCALETDGAVTTDTKPVVANGGAHG
jgi:hypothetical protein